MVTLQETIMVWVFLMHDRVHSICCVCPGDGASVCAGATAGVYAEGL